MNFKHLIVYFFLTCNLLWGGEFILSPSFLPSSSSQKSQAILKDYERFMNETAKKPLHVKLQAVNFYINGLVSIYDEQGYAKEEYWASRGEFLKNGGGDCEDYAIAKFYTLRDLGIASENLYLCTAKERYSGLRHMVLLVHNKEYIVLDNLSFKILSLKERVDLEIEGCMNETGYFTFKEEKLYNSLQKKSSIGAYESMLQRNKNEFLWKK